MHNSIIGMEKRCIMVTALLATLCPATVNPFVTGNKLNDDIRKYEPLYYDHEYLHQQHFRAKRATHPVISLEFWAFDTNFSISLQRDHTLFAPDIEIEASGSYLPFDLGRAYIGHLKEDYVNSGSAPTVRGLISTTGHFLGTILTDNEVFVVEKAKKYFKHQTDFHSVIYKASDVKLDLPPSICGRYNHHQNIINLQKSLYQEKLDNTRNTDMKYKTDSDWTDSVDEVKSNNETDWPNEDTEDRGTSKDDSDWKKTHISDSDWSEKYLHYSSDRHRRAVNTNTTCTLYLQADHLFYQHLGSNAETTIEELSRNVQTANAIFGAIDFDEDGSPDNINFVIKRIKLHTDPEAAGYRLNGNFGVEKFLELHSEENYDAYCLSYIFTHRDFGGGVLGLAWTAGENQEGGVCHKFTQFTVGKLSLNTGLVTTLNYGQAVSTLVTHLTFIHEIGHNLGSPHDKDGTNCAPGGTAGNYIMYSHAITGVQDNNDRFSTCSVESMAPVLESKARSDTGCFVDATSAICGNKVVEDGEECDCGYEADCVETCCTPQTDSPGGETSCRLKSTSVCSPSSGPCCDTTCQFITAESNHVCSTNTSCLEAAMCDGNSSRCPNPDWLPNKTPCEDGLVCVNGSCSGSACLKHDYDSCQCSPESEGNWRDDRLCVMCCVVGEQCRPSHEISGIPNTTNVPGSACYNYQGYCDVFARCREVDPTGTFSTIKRLLSPESLKSLKQWLITHWYVPVCAGVGFIVLMVIFVKVCGKRVPSDKELYERRLRRYGNRPRHGSNTVAPTSYM